jgi:uncharacterized protein
MYVLDTTATEAVVEASLMLLRLEERPCYVLWGEHAPPSRKGELMVEVEEVERLDGPGRGIGFAGVAERFYGEYFEEARELFSRTEALLSDRELDVLETAMYDFRGTLPAVLEKVARGREKKLRESLANPERDPEAAHEEYPLYVRFGGPPAGGRSRDWQGKLEAGVSCFRARQSLGNLEPDGAYVLDGSADSGKLALYKAFKEEEREAYLATGEEVGIGGAFEPLLKNVELELLPPGARIRITEEWTPVIVLFFALDMLRGIAFPPRVWRPPEEIVVPDGSASEAEPRPEPVQSVEEVLEAALPRSCSDLHGEEHWKRVAIAGARLAEETPGADKEIVALFAILHDAGRLRDFFDEQHSYRAGRLARRLLEGGPLLSPELLEVLVHAIEGHDKGETSEDPTVAVCFDSDRLNLWRLGIRPDPALLSTEAAKSPDLIEWARKLQHEQHSWDDIIEMNGKVLSGRDS